MKRKQSFLIPLLMAIVMMAMSPTRMWAEGIDLSTGEVTIDADVTYTHICLYQEATKLTINEGVTVTVTDNFSIQGTVENHGTLVVSDTEFVIEGKINNYGTFTYNGEIRNFGTFNNHGTFTCNGTFENYATFTQYCTGTYSSTSWTGKPVDLISHTKDHEYDAVDATCTTAGNIAYYHCSVCNRYFNSSDEEIAENSWVIEKLGHDLTHKAATEPTCTAVGNNEYWYCSRCKTYFKEESCETEYTDNINTPHGVRTAGGHTLTDS